MHRLSRLSNVHWLALALLFAIAASFFYNLAAVPLFDVDEGAFSQATREMFLRGDFLSTYLNGEPRYDKPILIYWLQAASVALFGFTEFAFRLPSALAASLWTLTVVWFSRHLLDTRRALLAGLMLAASLEVGVIGKAATTDALLNLLITLTMCHLYLFLSGRGTRYLYWSAAFSGLGFLAKGPVALAIPAAVSLLYCGVRGEWKAWLGLLSHPWAWLIFFAVAAPWYVAQYFYNGAEFFVGFFLEHNLGRFQSSMEGHSGPLWYYIPVLLAGVLPYTSLLLKTLAHAPQVWARDYSRYLLLWFGVVFVLFSLAATKLPHYVVYGYSAVFILLAAQVDSLRSRWLALLPQVIFFVLLLALPGALEYSIPHMRDAFAGEMLAGAGQYFGSAYYMGNGAAIAVSLVFIAARRVPLAYALSASGVMLCVVVSGLVLPVVGKVQQLPIKEAALLASQRPETVVMWRLHMPSFSVYSGRIAQRREPQPGDLVVTKAPHLGELKNYELLYRKQGIALVEILSSPPRPDASRRDEAERTKF